MCTREIGFSLAFNVTAKREAAGVVGAYEEAIEKFLQFINVQRQAYYSGAFVGNHVYKCLKKCREISQVRNSRLAHCAAQHMSIFRIELINNVIFLS